MDASLPLEPAVDARRPGRVLLRLSVVALVCVVLWFAYLLSDDVEAAEFAKVDTSRLKLFTGATWFDPRWEDEVRARLSALGRIGTEDVPAIERLLAQLRALSFIESVSEPEIIWPDGLKVDVKLRTPIACIQVGAQFQPVAADGELLSGRWPAPPERGEGFLPLVAVAAPNLERLHAGPVAWPDDARDGFAVAISMWEHLTPTELAHLGRVKIDAREARRASTENPGVVIQLEHGRRVLFGRAPNTDEPGELPVELKWKNLARALDDLEPASEGGAALVDWEMVDLRWDRAEMLLRGERADPTAKQTGPKSESRN